jgi:YVTN family beta-propeller protein
VLLEPRTSASARLWVVNPDNDSVGVIDTATNARVAEVTVGTGPRTLARAADGRIWVVNRDAASISIVNPATLAVAQSIALPAASQPHGIVIAADGTAYVTLEARGQVLKLSAAGATLATLSLPGTPRHLALSANGSRLLVSRFITPALPGEATALVNTAAGAAEVAVVDTAALALQATVPLRHSDRTDAENQGGGIPNYLGAPAISPDGTTAWVPSKQDNVRRGRLRSNQELDFQNSVRAVSSRVDLATLAENPAQRADHDNASLAAAAVHDPTGAYLFVALETSRQVAVLDAVRGAELLRVEAQLAPQSLALKKVLIVRLRLYYLCPI